MTKEEIKKLLLPAERQYQHNDCSGLLRGYDYEKVLEILSNRLEKQVMPKIAGEKTHSGEKSDIYFSNSTKQFTLVIKKLTEKEVIKLLDNL